jgi:hypothetical protein
MAVVINGSGSISGLSVGGLPEGVVTVSDLYATGTPSSTTFLRGDGAWAQAGFESGTTLVFSQTNAPTGWTKSTTHNNKALRIVSGTVSSGGSVAFTTAFASQAVVGTVGDTTLSTAQMPSHFHGNAYNSYGGVSGPGFYNPAYYPILGNTSSTGGGGSHTHSFSGTAINLAVQYVDVILAVKD